MLIYILYFLVLEISNFAGNISFYYTVYSIDSIQFLIDRVLGVIYNDLH